MNSYLLAVSGVSTQFGEAKKNSTWLCDYGGVEFSLCAPRPVAQSHPKLEDIGYEKHPTFYYLTRIQIQKLILLISESGIVLIER